MHEKANLQEQVQGTGTWNLNVPISFFSVATYRTATGKIVQVPVEVAGEQITGQFQGTEQLRS